MFDELVSLLIFHLATIFHPGFPSSPLFLDCTEDLCILPSGLFLPPVFLGKPLHVFSCFLQSALQLSQISSGSPPLVLFEIFTAIKGYHYSDWAPGSLRQRTNFFLDLGDISARKSQINSWWVAWRVGDLVVGSLFETGVADDQVAGQGKLQKSLILSILVIQPCRHALPHIWHSSCQHDHFSHIRDWKSQKEEFK